MAPWHRWRRRSFSVVCVIPRQAGPKKLALSLPQAPLIANINLMTSFTGIPQLIGWNQLLGKRGEICRPFRRPNVNDYSAILPNIVVIVVVVYSIVEKRRIRTLIHVNVVYAQTVH